MSVADSLLAYSFAALLLTLTPGLDTALILRTSTVEGGKKAFQAALGIDTGCFIWGAVVAFGLGALLAASALAYDLLKWCGAVYLCWLGIQLILKPRSHFNSQEIAAPSASIWTFLLVAIHVAIGTLWSLTLILASRYAAGLLKTPTFIRWMDRATGGVFMLFAAKLALSHR